MIPPSVAIASPLPTPAFAHGGIHDISVLMGGNQTPFNRAVTTPVTTVQKRLQFTWPWHYWTGRLGGGGAQAPWSGWGAKFHHIIRPGNPGTPGNPLDPIMRPFGGS